MDEEAAKAGAPQAGPAVGQSGKVGAEFLYRNQETRGIHITSPHFAQRSGAGFSLVLSRSTVRSRLFAVSTESRLCLVEPPVPERQPKEWQHANKKPYAGWLRNRCNVNAQVVEVLLKLGAGWVSADGGDLG